MSLPPRGVIDPAITPCQIADAEFVGLFMGEGHADLGAPKRGRSLVPRLRIDMRDDDRELLEWCRARFGGSITTRAATRSACWQLTGKVAVGECLAVLSGGRLPAKKRHEIALMAEAVDLVGTRGAHVLQASADRMFAIRSELIEMRRYKGVV